MTKLDIITLQPLMRSLPTLTVAESAPIRIRRARISDVDPIHDLVNYYADQEIMLPKTRPQLYNHLRSFVVAEADGQMVGCAGLKIMWSDLAEIVSLAVHPEFVGRQFGAELVLNLIDEARDLGLPTVFALTLRPTFFERLGFRRVQKYTLPHKIWQDCSFCPKQDRCDEIAMTREV